jgi:hypothetical protein
MAFKGTLKEFEVPDILQLVALQKKTGVLTFTSKSGFITLLFENGLIVGVDAFPKKLEMRYGSVLVKQDYISTEMLQRALSIQKRTNQKVGEILKSMGIMDEGAINTALKTQATEIVLSLFKWKSGEYNFKILNNIDKSLKTIEPIATDNIIMEGVQMLDEWPKMMERIYSESIVFEPAPIQRRKIEIIEEYKEIQEDEGVIYITDSESTILKYINGVNTVKEIVEMGIFTEYKIYKCLYSLIEKKVIKEKETRISDQEMEKKKISALRQSSLKLVGQYTIILISIFALIFILTFKKPLKPLNNKDILDKTSLFKKILTEIDANPVKK